MLTLKLWMYPVIYEFHSKIQKSSCICWGSLTLYVSYNFWGFFLDFILFFSLSSLWSTSFQSGNKKTYNLVDLCSFLSTVLRAGGRGRGHATVHQNIQFISISLTFQSSTFLFKILFLSLFGCCWRISGCCLIILLVWEWVLRACLTQLYYLTVLFHPTLNGGLFFQEIIPINVFFI